MTGGDAAVSAASPFPTVASAPQVGIILHYSSLSTLLWMAVKARVLYKEATWKAPQQPDGEASQPAPRPMLRYECPFPLPQPHRGAGSRGSFPYPTSRGWAGLALPYKPIPPTAVPCSPEGSLWVCGDTVPPRAGST